MKLKYNVIHHFRNTDDYFCIRRYSVLLNAAVQQCVRCLWYILSICTMLRILYFALLLCSIMYVVLDSHFYKCYVLIVNMVLISDAFIYQWAIDGIFYIIGLISVWTEHFISYCAFVCHCCSLCIEKLSVVIRTYVLQAGLKRSYVQSCFNGCQILSLVLKE